MKVLTEGTLIPIGIAVTVIGGASMWLTSLYLTQTAQAQKITEIQQAFEKVSTDQSKLLNITYDIKQDVAEIKGEIKRLQYKK